MFFGVIQDYFIYEEGDVIHHLSALSLSDLIVTPITGQHAKSKGDF
ncbi:hypothetical protein EC844_104162 [Acinetobacter calcoaceticus]|uniref:Uncharacterized protein n=1 Tax=Acinetobacter calcoaceticus TaxID=471 RepID=A0A4R1XXH5_ACICA|nr:hypothetical protein EC844_104162 [Acinetobacter calcoaceticus]